MKPNSMPSSWLPPFNPILGQAAQKVVKNMSINCKTGEAQAESPGREAGEAGVNSGDEAGGEGRLPGYGL